MTQGRKPVFLSILRWSARILAMVVIVFSISLFTGEGGIWNRLAGTVPGPDKYTLLLCLYLLYVIGLIIGLWLEGLGGVLSLVFIATHFSVLYMDGIDVLNLSYGIMLLPSFLFLLSWLFQRILIRRE